MSLHKKNSRKKRKTDSKSWIYDEDVNNVIKKFAKVQGDSKFQYN